MGAWLVPTSVPGDGGLSEHHWGDLGHVEKRAPCRAREGLERPQSGRGWVLSTLMVSGLQALRGLTIGSGGQALPRGHQP